MPGPVRVPGARSGRGGREVPVGVFRVQPCFDGMPLLDGVPFEFAAAGHPQLGFDQVESGGGFGDGVFDLQAGVDFQEREEFVVGPVEEFDGGGTR